MFSLWVNIITGVLAAEGGGKLKRHIQLTLKTCCYRFTRRLTTPTYSYLPPFLPSCLPVALTHSICISCWLPNEIK